MKPDLESLCLASDVILAIPSGSTEKRMTGVTFHLRNLQVTHFDLSPLYHTLREKFPELNLEGSVVLQDEVWLFQRGNGSLSQNGIIKLDKTVFFQELEQKQVTKRSIKSLHPILIGTHQNVPLGFTDACHKGEEIYFLAVAEDTVSTYEDGNYLGAYLGKINRSLKIEKLYPLDCPYKPEGIWIEFDKIFIVTDADNREMNSKLFSLDFQAFL